MNIKFVSVLFFVILSLAPNLAQANVKTALNIAKKNGFVGCDLNITEAFKSMPTNQVFEATVFPEIRNDFIKMTAVTGETGATFYFEAEFLKHNQKCYSTLTITADALVSCTQYRAVVPGYTSVRKVGNFEFFKGEADSSLYLMQAGPACVVMFQFSNVQPTTP